MQAIRVLANTAGCLRVFCGPGGANSERGFLMSSFSRWAPDFRPLVGRAKDAARREDQALRESKSSTVDVQLAGGTDVWQVAICTDDTAGITFTALLCWMAADVLRPVNLLCMVNVLARWESVCQSDAPGTGS